MRVLISGAGIGGLTLAYWLHKTGHTPVVIEKAPNIRTDGYMIDFGGSSWDVANRMGLIPQLDAAKHNIEEMVFKDTAGKTTARMPVEKLFHALNITDRYMTLDRRDVVETLYHAIQTDVEVHFATSLTAICQSAQGVEVTATGSQLDGTFDLVVGADGIHSNVRQLIFGSESQFADYLGYYVAAFYTLPLKGSLETGCVVHVEPGVQFGIYPLSDGRWLVIVIYKSANEGHISADQRLSALRSHLHNVGWITQQVLDALSPDTPIFMDTVTQIKMPHWSSSRVVMLGDAAYCPTLISGQGAGLAMAGAYFLTEELNQTSDVQTVLSRYEKHLRPYVEKVQTKARRFAPNFIPDSQLRIAMFNWAIRLIDFPPITHVFGKQLSLQSIIPASSAI
jgi:2-polyprenyl-6-methoxyphenol hydroxylase-like FAD-dependent oxidoreductase